MLSMDFMYKQELESAVQWWLTTPGAKSGSRRRALT